MSRLVLVLAFGLVVLTFSQYLNAQAPKSNEELINQLLSTSPEVRIRSSKYIYGAGIESTEIYEAVLKALEKQLTSLNSESPKLIQQEVAWHEKALASSGNKVYLPLLEELTESSARTVARHAKKAKEILLQAASKGSPYLDYKRVMVLTENQAENCEYLTQKNCSTYRSLDKCIESHKAQAARAGANSILILHDSKEYGVFKSGMMANYYKCNSDLTKNHSQIQAKPTEKAFGTPSYIDELKALAALRDEGIITDDEFQKQKAEILAREL